MLVLLLLLALFSCEPIARLRPKIWIEVVPPARTVFQQEETTSFEVKIHSNLPQCILSMYLRNMELEAEFPSEDQQVTLTKVSETHYRYDTGPLTVLGENTFTAKLYRVDKHKKQYLEQLRDRYTAKLEYYRQLLEETTDLRLQRIIQRMIETYECAIARIDKRIQMCMKLVSRDSATITVVRVGVEPLTIEVVPESLEPSHTLPGKSKTFSIAVENTGAFEIVLVSDTQLEFWDTGFGQCKFSTQLAQLDMTISPGEVSELLFDEVTIPEELELSELALRLLAVTTVGDSQVVDVTDTLVFPPALLTVELYNSPYVVRGDCDFLDLRVEEGAELYLSGSKVRITTRNVTLDGKLLPAQLTEIEIRGENLTVGPGGCLDAKGKGYPGGQGPGAGRDGNYYETGAGGGASNAEDGDDGDNPKWDFGWGGKQYTLRDSWMGSGGGGLIGPESSEGGGAIAIILTGTLTNNGVIDVSGNDGAAVPWVRCGTGGGGAGTIYISASTVAGMPFSFHAVGGKGGGKGEVLHPGGDGGDGRIIIDCEPGSVSVPSESFDVGEDGILVGLGDVDLDVDSNMDTVITADDDRMEMQEKAIIINVNNDDDGGGIDCHDGVINGALDKAELTKLLLRKMTVPAGGSVKLKVSNKAWLRIFDDTDAAVIGPPVADGGPNKDTHDVPVGKITTQPFLTYLIECFNHGNVTISLIKYDAAGKELARDELKVVPNVDRSPDGKTVRFYVGAAPATRPQADLEGIQAKITTPLPKVNYAPPIGKHRMRMTSRTNLAIGMHKRVSAGGHTKFIWLQTGLKHNREVGATPEQILYFEAGIFEDGVLVYHYPAKHPTVKKWPRQCALKIELDPNTGRVKCYLNNVPWVDEVLKKPGDTVGRFKGEKMLSYSIFSELFHSVNQNPGKLGDECIISDAQIKVGNRPQPWGPTNIQSGDLYIVDIRKDGKPKYVTTSHEWSYSYVSIKGFKMWDKVVEY